MIDSPEAAAPKTAPRLTQAVRAPQHEDKVLLVLTLIIGALVGLTVVAFILLTENLGSRLYPAGSAAWRRVLLPVAGALGTGLLLYRYFPNARGSGIPQTKVALFLRDGYISFRTVLGKFGLCSVSLATGIALGREGPSVQVGAGIASTLGRRLGLSPASIRALVPAGASAALAAAFNTPISAVLFSLEEVMGDMHAPVLGSIVLSSATSWIVLHLILGDEPLFHVPAYQLVHPVEFVWYAVLGVLGGLVSVFFVKLLLWQRKYFLRAPEAIQWCLPAVGGLTVGLLGWFVPDVLGVGYAVVGKALNGQMLLGTMALLVILKVVATATCYSSGNAGGIFGPSLFMGAMMGGAVGGVAHMLMPDYTGSAGAYALVGMGAAFAGIVRVPLTSVIMVFEITRDYSIIVPLMIANLISYFISSRLQEEAIYEALQHQDGIRLPSGARARETLLTVGHAYRPEAQALQVSQTISKAAALIDRKIGAFPVVDQYGFRGMVSADQLDDAIASGLGSATLERLAAEPAIIDELSQQSGPHVYPDDPLDAAMHWLADGKLKALPVLSRTSSRELKGTVTLSNVLAAYALGHTTARTAPPEARPSKLPMTLLAGVLTTLVGVAILAAFLNYFYRAERVKRADRYFSAGNELMQKDRLPEAIEQYRNALSISHRLDHRLALGLALVKASRLNEAAIYLDDVLRQQPESGPANLGVASIDVQQGRIDDAVTAFHHAIYGTWPDDPGGSRARARIALIDFLGKSRRTAQARAELIALVADAPAEPSLQKQIGHMLIDFGLAREAADLYHGMLKRGPPDANEYDGLGEAELALSDYKGAGRAFHSALEIDPTDRLAGRYAEMCDRVLALDPTLRGIGSRERFRRTRELLGAVVAQVAACAAPAESDSGPLQSDVQAAQASLARKNPPRYFSDAADSDLALAEKIWASRPRGCGAPSNEALARVMSKLANH
jgi:CIC family chloride channel protein